MTVNSSSGQQRQQQREQQQQQQANGEESSEQSPLLPQSCLDPLSSLPTPVNNNGLDHNQVLPHFTNNDINGNGHPNRHSRTRSVDVNAAAHQAETGSPASPRRVAPGRDHHRTRSLEEWANLFGISGVAVGAEEEVAQTRERELYRHRTSSSANPTTKRGRKRGPKLPPLPPKAPPPPLPSASHYSPSSPRKHVRRSTLDRIAEVENLDEDEDENDSWDQSQEDSDASNKRDTRRTAAATTTITAAEGIKPTLDDQRAAFAAAATYSNNSINFQTQTSSNSNYVDDNQSVGSNASSTLFSIPQYLSSSGRRYSYSGAEDSSVDDDNSTGAGSWLETLSRHSHHSRSDSFDYAASQRLAKFEKEQEAMFERKKQSMERELSNVLERDAVKSVRASRITSLCW